MCEQERARTHNDSMEKCRFECVFIFSYIFQEKRNHSRVPIKCLPSQAKYNLNTSNAQIVRHARAPPDTRYIGIYIYMCSCFIYREHSICIWTHRIEMRNKRRMIGIRMKQCDVHRFGCEQTHQRIAMRLSAVTTTVQTRTRRMRRSLFARQTMR